jgi:hypothetical protein
VQDIRSNHAYFPNPDEYTPKSPANAFCKIISQVFSCKSNVAFFKSFKGYLVYVEFLETIQELTGVTHELKRFLPGGLFSQHHANNGKKIFDQFWRVVELPDFNNSIARDKLQSLFSFNTVFFLVIRCPRYTC